MRDGVNAPHARGFGRLLHRLSAVFAVAGGLVLVSMVLLVVASVAGRALFARPVPGDFEIVGIGGAITIFLFLPYCYMQRGNVAVDIFVTHTPPKARRVLDAFASLVFAVVAGLFTWRMILGLRDVWFYEDISMIVGVPLWWAYPFAIASFGLLTVGALYTVVYPWEDARG
jgi:TRAP-type C4-dicarboxylate transport system permease small subunit